MFIRKTGFDEEDGTTATAVTHTSQTATTNPEWHEQLIIIFSTGDNDNNSKNIFHTLPPLLTH